MNKTGLMVTLVLILLIGLFTMFVLYVRSAEGKFMVTDIEVHPYKVVKIGTCFQGRFARCNFTLADKRSEIGLVAEYPYNLGQTVFRNSWKDVLGRFHESWDPWPKLN